MIIDGKAIAAEIQQELAQEIAAMNVRKPCLAVLLVGTHAPSQIYVRRKTEACKTIGITSIQRNFPDSISEQLLLSEINCLNNDPQVDGILLQLPLPFHLNANNIIHAIDPSKDVDGLHPYNAGKLLTGNPDGFAPCTPLGVQKLLERSKIDVQGKHVLVVGRSNLVGKPMAALLMQNAPGANATVTIAHSHTTNLKEIGQTADILIAAIGKAEFITADMIKKDAVVIDVGINQVANAKTSKGYKIVGDVDFDNVCEKCSFITPVPGGVGPMTIAMLLSNTVKARWLHS